MKPSVVLVESAGSGVVPEIPVAAVAALILAVNGVQDGPTSPTGGSPKVLAELKLYGPADSDKGATGLIFAGDGIGAANKISPNWVMHYGLVAGIQVVHRPKFVVGQIGTEGGRKDVEFIDRGATTVQQ